jgi:IS30 family transposase
VEQADGKRGFLEREGLCSVNENRPSEEGCSMLADDFEKSAVSRRGPLRDLLSGGEEHWEGDLLRGAGNSHVATLVERRSRFCMLVKVPGKDTATVVAALSQHVLQLPATLRRSLTWDRGLEMAQHKNFTMATDVQVYFCDPQSPWQRGSNENTNGLLRQYLPKNADLSTFSQSELDAIALRLNTRPRQTLGFQTPADKLQASVASTP